MSGALAGTVNVNVPTWVPLPVTAVEYITEVLPSSANPVTKGSVMM